MHKWQVKDIEKWHKILEHLLSIDSNPSNTSTAALEISLAKSIQVRMRCQLQAKEPHLAIVNMWLDPYLEAVMTSADCVGGVIGGIYSAKVEVVREADGTDRNLDLLGTRFVWGLTNALGTEAKFFWSDLQFTKAGKYRLRITVTEHLSMRGDPPDGERAQTTTEPIQVAPPIPTFSE